MTTHNMNFRPLEPKRNPTTQHSFGPEFGYKPVTYTCWCGFRSTSYSDVATHITDARVQEHTPRHLTTIPAGDSSNPAGIEIASTSYGDARDAVEIRVISHEGDDDYRRYMMLVRRADLPFLIEALERHRLRSTDPADPCAACAGYAFAARLTDAAMQTSHTCGSSPSKQP